MFALFSGIGIPEIILILAVVLLLFGARKLPEIARSMGKGIQEFKAGLKDKPSEDKKKSQDKPTEDK